MPGLSQLLHLIGYAGLVFGVLLSVNTGRKLAQRRHDAELVARYGRRLPGLGLVLYVYMMIAFIVNIFTVALIQMVTSEAKFLFALLTGSLTGFLAGTLMTIILIAVSYFYFRRRYESVDKPLTREGKIALKGVDLGSRAYEEARRRLRGG